MFIQWGSHSHAINEAGLHIDYKTVWDNFGRARGYIATFTVRGVLMADNPAALTTKMSALEVAYGTGNKDFALLYDDASPTRHVLATADTIGGTQVVDFKWLAGNPGIWGMETEYVTKRTYEVIVQGEVHVTLGVIEWHESLQVIGDGGALFRMMPSLTAAPEPQTTQQASSFIVVQSGYAIGDHSTPTESSPLFSRLFMHAKQSWVKRETPQRYRLLQNDRHPISWHYVFESSSGLIGVPTPYVVP